MVKAPEYAAARASDTGSSFRMFCKCQGPQPRASASTLSSNSNPNQQGSLQVRSWLGAGHSSLLVTLIFHAAVACWLLAGNGGMDPYSGPKVTVSTLFPFPEPHSGFNFLFHSPGLPPQSCFDFNFPNTG